VLLYEYILPVINDTKIICICRAKPLESFYLLNNLFIFQYDMDAVLILCNK